MASAIVLAGAAIPLAGCSQNHEPGGATSPVADNVDQARDVPRELFAREPRALITQAGADSDTADMEAIAVQPEEEMLHWPPGRILVRVFERGAAQSIGTALADAGKLEPASGSTLIEGGAIGTNATENQPAVAFYVAPDRLLMPTSALTPSALVSLGYTDGATVYGLVEKRDPASGLALVFTPRGGNALVLDGSQSDEPAPPQSFLNGQPELLNGRVAGIWLAAKDGAAHFVAASRLADFSGILPTASPQYPAQPLRLVAPAPQAESGAQTTQDDR